ncbi:hypothetical protein FSP39_010366 [Pinctada imbricata]|uniref:Uncharacterized protein n=1 Tax=Pinctada imbricata TaxID=66713 RepID=A0AA88YQN9_PINIB|nr:hypothetical protein FSP39_010366 [Pinctada imbricata]
MLQTMSVVVNHPHIGRTKISEVLSHSVPYKFRILGHVEDFFPRPSEPTDISKIILSRVSLSGLIIRKEWSHYREYLCPKCPSVNHDTVPDLLYIFVMRFRISDKSGSLIANMWKEDAVSNSLFIHIHSLSFVESFLAYDIICLDFLFYSSLKVTFFNDVTPTELIQDAKLFTRIKEQLNALCDQEDRGVLPLFECCIKSYVTLEGGTTAYQIFDTCLV